MKEAIIWASPSQLRQLFVMLIVFCNVSNPLALWNCFWKFMSEDVSYKIKEALRLFSYELPKMQLKNYTLIELEKILSNCSTTLSAFDLPTPESSVIPHFQNRLLAEELDYNIVQLEQQYLNLLSTLNVEQKEIHDAVVDSVMTNSGMTQIERQEIAQFAAWILSVGDGSPNCGTTLNSLDEQWIKISSDLLLPNSDDPIKSIILATYEDMSNQYRNINYFKERAIIAPTNDAVAIINEQALELLSGQASTFYSFDSICNSA
ncbi:hypothetical protein Cni_G04813 [Canna indica]|uniref:ATP-dependent DNA helicase n=1 Tax=Canna indica TaxID=4628 RepID=A0AAQ3JU60_9LILI|nr:hypothetical protein Cni_G04813 [Canna indica]